jgi:hypothetical protein
MTARPAQPVTHPEPKKDIREHTFAVFDESDFKNRLSDEYKILQDKIDKIGGFRFTIKGWSITAVVAGIGIGGKSGLATACVVALGLVVMLFFFFSLEHEQVKQSRLFGNRARQIEDAFRRIRRGKGEEVFASFPVPYLAHDLVLAKVQERSKSRGSGSSLPTNPSEQGNTRWRSLKEAHIGLYAVLIILAVASLLPQHRAIVTHWREFKQSLGYTPPQPKSEPVELPRRIP